MKPLNAIEEEFILKYNGTIMKVTKLSTGLAAFGYVSGSISSISFKSYCTLEGTSMSKLPSFADGSIKDLRLDKFLPLQGWYNLGGNGGAFFLVRNSAKQWKNSFCGDMYSIFQSDASPKNNSYVKAVVGSKYLPYTKAVDKVLGGVRPSCAIGLNLCIKGDPLSLNKSCDLYYNTTRIGVATPKGVELSPAIRTLAEVLDYEGVPVICQ